MVFALRSSSISSACFWLSAPPWTCSFRYSGQSLSNSFFDGSTSPSYILHNQSYAGSIYPSGSSFQSNEYLYRSAVFSAPASVSSTNPNRKNILTSVGMSFVSRLRKKAFSYILWKFSVMLRLSLLISSDLSFFSSDLVNWRISRLNASAVSLSTSEKDNIVSNAFVIAGSFPLPSAAFNRLLFSSFDFCAWYSLMKSAVFSRTSSMSLAKVSYSVPISRAITAACMTVPIQKTISDV